NTMTHPLFNDFFQGTARSFLRRTIRQALDEDGPDLTSDALFDPEEPLVARVVSKEEAVLAGLPIIPLVLDGACAGNTSCSLDFQVREGALVTKDGVVVDIQGPARVLLKAERVLLNFVSHLSGVATLTSSFVQRLQGSRTRLLDTRKTLPGLRYPEKYAVLVGGGVNHRLDLAGMLMLKYNHIDRAGSISLAVERLRRRYPDCPPIEVECRTRQEVEEAVRCAVDRIMLDNMDPASMTEALSLIPGTIESEISGGVTLDNVAALGGLGADFISVGCITNSARAVDLSMRLGPDRNGSAP
ncbi:MAG: carboxylating nicotinate-nucleotide diphosphorylase, partial [Desulfohalobiaceae bacterium]